MSDRLSFLWSIMYSAFVLQIKLRLTHPLSLSCIANLTSLSCSACLSLYRYPTQPLFSSHANITVRLNSTKYGASLAWPDLFALIILIDKHLGERGSGHTRLIWSVSKLNSLLSATRTTAPTKYGASVTQDLKSLFFVA